MTHFHSLSAAGFAATAISYGPARMGFGLFVPEFRSAFSMSAPTVGMISSLGFAGFFLGLLVAQWLLNRRGPQVPVLSGLAAATIGILTVAVAPTIPILALGVFLAASSAGFAWTPFNDAVHRKIRDIDRPAALSEISTGTSVGIGIAGAVALAMVLMGFDWQTCWGLFAAGSLAALVANWAALRHVEKSPEEGPEQGWRDLLHRDALPLFLVAFVFGVTSAVFISFGADRFAGDSGPAGLPVGAAPSVVYIAYGVFGLAGLLTGRLREVIGLPWLLRVLMLLGATSLALAGLVPGGWAGLISSSGLQGIHVMMTSAVLAFWSEKLFPSFPSLGFTAALLATAAGSVAGPALAGMASSAFGAGAVFLGVAILPFLLALALVDRVVSDTPAVEGGTADRTATA